MLSTHSPHIGPLHYSSSAELNVLFGASESGSLSVHVSASASLCFRNDFSALFWHINSPVQILTSMSGLKLPLSTVMTSDSQPEGSTSVRSKPKHQSFIIHDSLLIKDVASYLRTI